MARKSKSADSALNPQLILHNPDFDGMGWSWADLFGSPLLDGGPLFDRGSPFSHAALGGDSITLLDRSDTVSFAKGGGGKPGGGGSGGGSGVVGSYFAGSDDGTAGYDIWIEFKGTGWTTELQTAFEHAADYFVTVINQDIGGGGTYRGKVIDDLYVSAELTSIDGVGNILGQAGPTAIWTSNDLTAAGKMQFDSADAQYYYNEGLWDDIVTHEMMHVLGFGSLWNYGSHHLVNDDPDPTHNDQYIGQNGLAAFRAVTGDETIPFIPVEADGGSGTAGSHWDEQLLGNELMTGYINGSNYLSPFSVMSLADLGYSIGYQPYEDLPAPAIA